MSDTESLKDVQWLFFDVFGTVVDCTFSPCCTRPPLTSTAGKSHMTRSMLAVAKRVEPDAAKEHPEATDEFWQDRVQQWRNGFMKSARAHQGKREEGGMDVSVSLIPHVFVPSGCICCRKAIGGSWIRFWRNGRLVTSGTRERGMSSSRNGTNYKVRLPLIPLHIADYSFRRLA